MSHRRCPIPFTAAPRGTCRWCGFEIICGGKPNRRARWHGPCLVDYEEHSRPRVQFRALVARDGRECGECHGARDRLTPLEVEHRIPLWKVRHLPDDQRRWYYGLGNLWLLCRTCHKPKTRHEAAERAHLDRMTDPKPSRGRKMPSRPFPKRMEART